MGLLGKMHILARIAHIRFVQNRIHRMRQRLINAAAGHHVAAEKKPQGHETKINSKPQHPSSREAPIMKCQNGEQLNSSHESRCQCRAKRNISDWSAWRWRKK